MAATGGYPLLLDRWDAAASGAENVLSLTSDALSPLVVNASTLLLDLPDADGFRRTLNAIGRGATRHSEITNHAGQRIDRTLAYLERAGFVQRVTPVGEGRQHAPHHELADTYLSFWYAVVERDLQLIDGGQGRAAIERAMPRWLTHLGSVFEAEARRHLERLVAEGRLPSGSVVGRWWTHRPRQVEIDPVAVTGTTWSVAGEAKWADELAAWDLRRLRQQLNVIGKRAERSQLAFWARRGYSPDFVAAAGDALRFTADDLLS